MAQSRKSTPKYEIVTIDTDVVISGPASKTECAMIARGMNRRGRPPVIRIRRVAHEAA